MDLIVKSSRCFWNKPLVSQYQHGNMALKKSRNGEEWDAT